MQFVAKDFVKGIVRKYDKFGVEVGARNRHAGRFQQRHHDLTIDCQADDTVVGSDRKLKYVIGIEQHRSGRKRKR